MALFILPPNPGNHTKTTTSPLFLISWVLFLGVTPHPVVVSLHGSPTQDNTPNNSSLFHSSKMAYCRGFSVLLLFFLLPPSIFDLFDLKHHPLSHPSITCVMCVWNNTVLVWACKGLSCRQEQLSYFWTVVTFHIALIKCQTFLFFQQRAVMYLLSLSKFLIKVLSGCFHQNSPMPFFHHEILLTKNIMYT